MTERNITVRAVYLGEENCLSLPFEFFYLGHWQILLPMVYENEKNDTYLVKNIELIFGDIVKTKDKRIGFTPGTQIAIFKVPLSKAETFNNISNWRFEKLSWSKYRDLKDIKYVEVLNKKIALEKSLTEDWIKFFEQGDLKLPQKVIFSVVCDEQKSQWELDKKEFEFFSLWQAVEYLEQSFFFINKKASVEILFDGELFYKTPSDL